MAQRRNGTGAAHPRRSSRDESRLTILVALAANAVIAVAKLLAGLASGSAAMLAEAAHSTADTIDQLVLLASLRLGRRPPDDEHQFGHGKERFFWAFVAAVWIFFAGALFSIGEGIAALHGGRALGDPTAAFVVLALAFAAEGVSLIRAARHLREGARQSRTSFGRFVREVRDPAPRVVFLEDGAAVAGVVVAAAGLTASVLTGSEVPDAFASIAVGLILVAAAVGVGTHAKALLLGEAARPETHTELRREIEKHPDVVSLPELRTMHIGPDDVLVAANVELRGDLSVAEAQGVSATIVDDLRDLDPSIRHVFLHPSPSRADETLCGSIRAPWVIRDFVSDGEYERLPQARPPTKPAPGVWPVGTDAGPGDVCQRRYPLRNASKPQPSSSWSYCCSLSCRSPSSRVPRSIRSRWSWCSQLRPGAPWATPSRHRGPSGTPWRPRVSGRRDDRPREAGPALARPGLPGRSGSRPGDGGGALRREGRAS